MTRLWAADVRWTGVVRWRRPNLSVIYAYYCRFPSGQETVVKVGKKTVFSISFPGGRCMEINYENPATNSGSRAIGIEINEQNDIAVYGILQ